MNYTSCGLDVECIAVSSLALHNIRITLKYNTQSKQTGYIFGLEA